MKSSRRYGLPMQIREVFRIVASLFVDVLHYMALGCRSGKSLAAENLVDRLASPRVSLDWLIPLGESNLRAIVKEWADHYNRGRPHMSLRPGLPDPPTDLPARLQTATLTVENFNVLARSALGGLHHEYSVASPA